MAKIYAIHGGGDWADASADYLVLPAGMDIAFEKELWDRQYRQEYVPGKIKYVGFLEYLKSKGAVEPSSDELEIFSDY